MIATALDQREKRKDHKHKGGKMGRRLIGLVKTGHFVKYLKLFKGSIQSFMKVSSHGPKIHWLLNDFIVVLDLKNRHTKSTR